MLQFKGVPSFSKVINNRNGAGGVESSSVVTTAQGTASYPLVKSLRLQENHMLSPRTWKLFLAKWLITSVHLNPFI